MMNELNAYRELARRLLEEEEVLENNKPKKGSFRDYVPTLGTKIKLNELFETAPEHLRKTLPKIAFEARRQSLEKRGAVRKRKEHYREKLAREKARNYLAENKETTT